MRISDWSSDVCSSDLFRDHPRKTLMGGKMMLFTRRYALGMLGAGMGMGAGMGVGLRSAPAFGQDKASRALEGHILCNTPAIHVPAHAGRISEARRVGKEKVGTVSIAVDTVARKK